MSQSRAAFGAIFNIYQLLTEYVCFSTLHSKTSLILYADG